MSDPSSIFHFFARIMERRGYLSEKENLEDFEFPQYMIAARSKGTFPDIVLRTNSSEKYPGGELIEIKSSQTYAIASFNSTFPHEIRAVDQMAKNVLDQINEAGENPQTLVNRKVYYLLFGRNKRARPAPHSKMCLVSGAFFETMSTLKLIQSAFRQVASDSVSGEDSIPDEHIEHFDDQEAFAKTRKVEGASVKVRFRVMMEAVPEVNLFSDSRFPSIMENTVNFLSPLRPEELPTQIEGLHPWTNAPDYISKSEQFNLLDNAYDDIDPKLKLVTRVGHLIHPVSKTGFFQVQAPMR